MLCKLSPVFGVAGLRLNKIARKRIYDVFTNCSLHYQLKCKYTSLHVRQNDIKKVIEAPKRHHSVSKTSLMTLIK